jgi:predicted AlkP superfamily phosphohydrolase/phosphomutase
MIRIRHIMALILALAAAGCSAPDDDFHMPVFPAEKTAAEFPGITVPLQEGGPTRSAAADGPVWLIGVDGITWDMLQPMIDRGELPNFAALAVEGTRGVLLSEEPTISPALWATISTGMPRFEHGVVNFLVKLPGSYDAAESGPPDRRSPAVWELAGAAGLRSTVINWFGSFPAEAIDGYYVSKGFDPENPGPGQVHPAGFSETLKDEAVVRMPGQLAQEISRSKFLQDTLVDDARAMAVLRVIAGREITPCTAIYFSGTDVAQHITWRHMDPASQQFPQDGSPDPRRAGVIKAYYRLIDHFLGEIRELAPDDATLVIVSDHGGGPVQPGEAYHFRLEVLLRALGLMKDGGGGEAFAIDEMYRHDKRIWLELAGVELAGIIRADEARDKTEEVCRRLESLRTDDKQPLFESVVNHTLEQGWVPGEPAATVRFSPEALFTEKVWEGDQGYNFVQVRMRHSDISGAHRLEGVVILNGPDIRPAALDDPATIYQIAPTLLYLLGLPQDGRMVALAPLRGGVLEEAITPDRLGRQPIRMIPEYPGTDRSALLRSISNPSAPDPSREREMEKLRSLGYIQ